MPALESAYGREEPAIRRGIIEVLQEIDAPGRDSLLLRAAQDPDVDVRTQAILGLGRSHDERARSVVEAALEDREPAIRDAAVEACATVCLTPSALRRLVDIAIHEPPILRIMRPRQTLRSLIGAENERQATAAREAIEAAARPLLREDSGAEERVRAALLIADLEDPAATPWLVDVLEHGLPGADERLRLLIQAQTIQTLGAAGDATCIDVLGRMSRRPTDPLKEAACQALQRLAQRGVEGAVAESRRCTAGNG
jgi:HEAT repeat protein